MYRKKTLFTLAPKGFQLYRHTDDTGHVETAEAEGMPLPAWPDGSWCFEVALFLNSGNSRLSRSSRGGSYSTITYALSHLVRYCYRNRIGFLEMTDSQFTMFMNGLSAKEQLPDGSIVTPRADKRILQIGRRALSFLSYIGEFYDTPNFVAQEGTIRGFMKIYSHEPNRRGGKTVIKHYWHHESFPQDSPKKRRHPIGDEYISQLRRAVVTLNQSPYLRQRKFLLVRLLDATGARRIEMVNLTTASVAKAQAMLSRGEEPKLLFKTFKRRGDAPERLVPIDEVDLAALVSYIEKYRSPLVEKVGFDCGFVLLSVKGTKLEPNTVTLELYQLRKAAGITGKAHPHLFRHRYISKKLVHLISDRSFGTAEALIAFLLKTGAEMQKLLEYTGHASLKSLEPYIDDAFMALNGPKLLIDGKDLSRLSASTQASVEELMLMQGTVPPEELAHLAISSLKAFASELSRPT